jgi:chemotaxis-related protein WspD
MNDTQKKIEQACWRHIGVWGESSGTCPELPRVVHCHNCEVFAQAARQVFSDHASKGEPVEEFDSSDDELVSHGDASVLPLRLGEVWVGVPPKSVSIVSEVKKIRSIPNRSDEVLLGITSIQGEVVPCVSISKILSVSRDSVEERQHLSGIYERLVVLDVEQLHIAVPVDEVRGVMHFFNDDLQHEKIDGALSENFIDGCLQLDEGDVLSLNIDYLGSELLRVLK